MNEKQEGMELEIKFSEKSKFKIWYELEERCFGHIKRMDGKIREGTSV
jgi:hypothetical protein